MKKSPPKGEILFYSLFVENARPCRRKFRPAFYGRNPGGFQGEPHSSSGQSPLSSGHPSGYPSCRSLVPPLHRTNAPLVCVGVGTGDAVRQSALRFVFGASRKWNEVDFAPTKSHVSFVRGLRCVYGPAASEPQTGQGRGPLLPPGQGPGPLQGVGAVVMGSQGEFRELL